MESARHKGLLLCVEGIDCSGKTTQMQRLACFIASLGRSCHITAEPSKGPIGRLLRQALCGDEPLTDPTLALLFAADRLDHLEREVLPKLEAGFVVLTDRYLLSSLAYQSTSLPLAWVQTINARARRPDGCILLRLSPRTAAERQAQRGGKPEHFDALARQQKVAEAYDTLVNEADYPCCSVDAEQNIDAVARDIARFVDRLLQGDPT